MTPFISWRENPGYFTSHIKILPLPAPFWPTTTVRFSSTWLRLNEALLGFHPWGWHLTSVLAHVAVGLTSFYRLALRPRGPMGWRERRR